MQGLLVACVASSRVPAPTNSSSEVRQPGLQLLLNCLANTVNPKLMKSQRNRTKSGRMGNVEGICTVLVEACPTNT